MAVFPDEDRESYPDMFKLPEGCYEVALYCRKQGCTAFGRLARRRLFRSCTRLPRAQASFAY